MRIMALDVGQKTVGVAVSDPLGLTGQGLETIRRGQNRELERLWQLILEYEVEELLIGLPLRTDGSQGPEAQRVRQFAQRLDQYLKDRDVQLPISYQDERFTTAQAEKLLLAADVKRAGRKAVVDKLAAALILQSYLDRRSV
ncbi:MAG: Holliday junction resolvase RuvX [Limnochordia bacterium]|jgi:putative Holliday junction resolvase